MTIYKGFWDGPGNRKIFAWRVREIVSGFSGVFVGGIKRKRPYMSLVRYYIGKLNLSPRWDVRCEDVLSAALSVYRIEKKRDSRGRDCFYVLFSAYDFRHVLDVTRVFRANGIVGKLCYTDVQNRAGDIQKMLALRVRDKNQKFMIDVQRTIDDVTYFRDTVLPEYNAAHEKKKYILPELFGPYSR